MSDRKLVIDGNGLVVSQGETAIGNITESNIPGWTKTEIPDTALDNQKVTSYVVGNLADFEMFNFTVKAGGETAISPENSLWTIKSPNGATLAFYGQVVSMGSPSVANGSGLLIPVGVKVTNVSGAAVVAPVYTSGGIVSSGGTI